MSENACYGDSECQLLFQFIEQTALMHSSVNSSSNQQEPAQLSIKRSFHRVDPIALSKQIFFCPFLFIMSDFTEQDSIYGRPMLCRCLSLSYKCDIENYKETNTIESDLIKNLYLILYIILILASFCINFLTSTLLINEHKNNLRYLKCIFFCNKPNNNERTLDRRVITNNQQLNQIASLNSISDVLIVCLLISYIIITLYVIPNQTYLFYTNLNLLDCKTSEFFKAFSVSLSIYSLVGISIQRFFAIKFSQYSCTIIKGRLIDMISFISVCSFFRSIGSIIHTFVFSRYYRRYLVTTILMVLIWVISFVFGFYNMAQYHDEYLPLKGIEFYENNISCQFSRDLKSSAKFCSSKNYTDLNTEDISTSDIVFVISLLVVPNLIVILSYTWVCYHIWSQGSKLNMSSFRVYYKENKRLVAQEMKRIEQVKVPVKPLNTNKITNENNSSIDSIVNAKPKNKTEVRLIGRLEEGKERGKTSSVSSEVLNKILKNSTNQSIQSYHQFSIKKRNMSVTLTTFLMVMCFSLCWTPFFIFPIFYSKIVNTNIYVNIKVVIHLVGYSSAIWNPIILIIKSKRFKLKVAKLLKRIFCFLAQTNMRDGSDLILKRDEPRPTEILNGIKSDSSSNASVRSDVKLQDSQL